MNYVFLDLEWNNAYSKKHGRFVNEIIEIGAVKLDESLREIGRFDVFIKSQLTRRLGTRFKDLTHISNEDMRYGIPFKDAFERFKSWCGEDFLTVTWSNSDFYTIVENFDLFSGTLPTDYFGDFLDLQKYYQTVVPSDDNNQVSLKNAAEHLGVSLNDISLHRASDDSAVTADVFRKIHNLGNYKKLTVDTRNPKFYERIAFKPFYITDINSPDLKKSDFSFRCKSCRTKAVPATEWKVKNNRFWNTLICPKCRCCFTGRVAVKRTYEGTSVKKTAVYKTAQKSEKPKVETNSEQYRREKAKVGE